MSCSAERSMKKFYNLRGLLKYTFGSPLFADVPVYMNDSSFVL